jgi:hypothetical protein
MTREEINQLIEPQGFRPFAIVTQGGLRMEIPHPEFVDLPPMEEEMEPASYVTVYTRGRVAIAKFIDLDAIDHIDWEVNIKRKRS